MNFKFREKEGELGEPRTAELELETVTLETPVNIHTHSEVKNHQKGYNILPARRKDIKIQECILDLGSQDQVDREFGSKYSYQLKERIKALSKPRMRNILHVRFNPKKVQLSPTQVLNLVKSQKADSQLSMITIPDPIRDFNEDWKKSLTKSIEYAKHSIETGHKAAFMPSVYLEQPKNIIKAKVEWLVEQDIHALAFRGTGKDIHLKVTMAENIIRESEKSIWLHMFDVSKKIFLEISHSHLLPLLGIDTISTRKSFSFSSETKAKDDGSGGDFATPTGIPFKTQQTTKTTNQRLNRDIFEGEVLGFMNTDEIKHTFGDVLGCTCDLCKQMGSITNLDESLSSPNRSALVQVHETHSFLGEFRNIQQSIKDNEVTEYYKEKSMIDNNIIMLKEYYPVLKEE